MWKQDDDYWDFIREMRDALIDKSKKAELSRGEQFQLGILLGMMPPERMYNCWGQEIVHTGVTTPPLPEGERP